MKSRNGSARSVQHRRESSRVHHAEPAHTTKRRTVHHTPVNEPDFGDMTDMVMKYLGKALLGTEKRWSKGSNHMNKLLMRLLNKHPVAAMGSVTALGGVLALLLGKTLQGDVHDKHHSALGDIKNKIFERADDSVDLIGEALGFLAAEMKEHSIDLYDELMDNYVKKYPLYTAAGAAVLSGLLTLWLKSKR